MLLSFQKCLISEGSLVCPYGNMEIFKKEKGFQCAYLSPLLSKGKFNTIILCSYLFFFVLYLIYLLERNYKTKTFFQLDTMPSYFIVHFQIFVHVKKYNDRRKNNYFTKLSY